LLLLTKSYNIEVLSNQKIATAREGFEAQLLEKDYQWEKKLADAENENEKKIVKLMNDSFEQRQQALKEHNAEKESLTKIYQTQQVNDERIIAELRRRIRKLEKSSSVNFKFAEQEIENKEVSLHSLREKGELRIVFELREATLLAEIERKDAELERKSKIIEDLERTAEVRSKKIQLLHSCLTLHYFIACLTNKLLSLIFILFYLPLFIPFSFTANHIHVGDST
jgi:hypothetical protein